MMARVLQTNHHVFSRFVHMNVVEKIIPITQKLFLQGRHIHAGHVTFNFQVAIAIALAFRQGEGNKKVFLIRGKLGCDGQNLEVQIPAAQIIFSQKLLVIGDAIWIVVI